MGVAAIYLWACPMDVVMVPDGTRKKLEPMSHV